MKNKIFSENIVGIDHLALAVPDLELAVCWMRDVLGFAVDEKRETLGKYSGMKSAVMRLGPITIVVTEGIGATSQTSKFVSVHGAGVQHIAFKVQDLEAARVELASNGLEFSSPRLDSDGLSQIFSTRNGATGMMVELIERRDFDGFRDENVQRLFDSLEEKALV